MVSQEGIDIDAQDPTTQRINDATINSSTTLDINSAAISSNLSNNNYNNANAKIMPNKLSAAQWHRNRRQQMLQKYGDQIRPLERDANSQTLGGSLLVAGNLILATLAILCGRLHHWPTTLALALFPGSILSLWQLQLLHDNLHGCLLDKHQTQFHILGFPIKKQKLQSAILFWGSMPSIFGYYLYLQYGHLSHHQQVGLPESSNLRQVFESRDVKFEDGDVLFVAHRMKLLGQMGPRWVTRNGKELILSISRFGFSKWKPLKPFWNMLVFALSFSYERFMLSFNDVVVAVTGRNYFFPNKPQQFHQECATYCRAAVAMRALLFWLGGRSWHALIFLWLSEILWSLPPHPASAMFVTNHGSKLNLSHDEGGVASSPVGACLPSSSTYAGRWYSALTLGTNFHVEHHDFPTIPFQHLWRLRHIAPEYYPALGHQDHWWKILRKAFGQPDYYACMNDMESIR